MTQANPDIKVLQKGELTFAKIVEAESAILGAELKGVVLRPADYLSAQAKDLAHYTLYTSDLEENSQLSMAEWTQLPTRDFFALLKKAFPNKPQDSQSIQAMAGALTYKLNPFKARSDWDAFQPLVDRIKQESLDESEMKALVRLCFDTLKKAEALTEKFRTWIILNMRKDDPGDVNEFMLRLGANLTYANKRVRLVTEEWAIATLIHEPAATTGKSTSKQLPQGSGNDKGGSNDKKRQREEPSALAVLCALCGRKGHAKGDCLFKAHPDAKAWAARKRSTLPAKETLSGAAINVELPKPAKQQRRGENIHTCYLSTNTDSHETKVEGHTLRCGVYTKSATHTKYVDTLIDTGALQSNYIGPNLATWLTSQGEVLFTENIGCLVCSHSGCSQTKQYDVFDLGVLNENNNKIENVSIKAWLLNTSPYDLIIGRPSIMTNKLLNKTSFAGEKFTFALSDTVVRNTNDNKQLQQTTQNNSNIIIQNTDYDNNNSDKTENITSSPAQKLSKSKKRVYFNVDSLSDLPKMYDPHTTVTSA